MATIAPPLENGDRLDQRTYHARYEAMPEHVHAELIGGIVYMASPMKCPHGRQSTPLIRWLAEYEENTSGTEVFVGVTNILGPESEPEPDACMIILPKNGGQTWEDDKHYLNGPLVFGLMAPLYSAVIENVSLPFSGKDWPRRNMPILPTNFRDTK